MKTIQGIVIGVVLCLCIAAAAPVKKYWQDQLLKPDQAWIEAYGYNGESILAYNARSLVLLANQNGPAIRQLSEQVVELDKRLKALEPIVDPNEAKE
jgi:hypothetical protein